MWGLGVMKPQGVDVCVDTWLGQDAQGVMRHLPTYLASCVSGWLST